MSAKMLPISHLADVLEAEIQRQNLDAEGIKKLFCISPKEVGRLLNGTVKRPHEKTIREICAGLQIDPQPYLASRAAFHASRKRLMLSQEITGEQLERAAKVASALGEEKFTLRRLLEIISLVQTGEAGEPT